MTTGKTRTLFSLLTDTARVGFVYMIFIVMVLVLMANWTLPYFSTLKPDLVLLAVFYWIIYRSGMMPYWVVFCAGLALDLLNPAFPVGLHAVSYLFIAGLIKPRRRTLMGQPFTIVWVVFLMAVVIDLVIKWAGISLFTSNHLSGSVLLLNGMITILFFPIFMPFFVMLHRLLPTGRGMVQV